MDAAEKKILMRKILDALPEADGKPVTEALFAAPAAPVMIDDMADVLPEDGTVPYEKMTPSQRLMEDTFFREPKLVELPARIAHSAWLMGGLEKRNGLRAVNAFGAMGAKRENEPVVEIMVLAFAVLEACGPAGLMDTMDELVFGQPRYAVFRADAEPLIRKYVL